MFNFKNKSSNSASNLKGLDESIHYLLNTNNSNIPSVDKFHTLMYLQKIICNSIVYGEFGYKALLTPHFVPQLELSDFLPRNSNYRRFDLDDDPIYLNSNDAAFIALPWNNERIINDIRVIGNDANNLFDARNPNINNVYIYPLGIILVGASGNHSQFIGLLKSELTKLKVNSIYDISEELIKSNDGQFTNFFGSSEENTLMKKWLSTMEIGKNLLKYNNFPSNIVSHMRDKGNKNDSEQINQITYKNKVLTEFSNSAYQKLTEDVNFDHVPKVIWELWYNKNNEYSVINLTNENADDTKWKTLYEMLKKEFDKLK